MQLYAISRIFLVHFKSSLEMGDSYFPFWLVRLSERYKFPSDEVWGEAPFPMSATDLTHSEHRRTHLEA